MSPESTSPTTRYGYTEAEIKAHRKAWLKDLESGEYPQGKGALVVVSYDGNKSYCCLGVACETARKSGLALRIEEKERVVCSDTVMGQRSSSLPTTVRTLFSLPLCRIGWEWLAQIRQ